MYAQSAAGSFLRQEKERCDAVMHDSEFPLDERKPGNLLAGLLGNADSLMRKSDGEPDELHNQNFLPPRPRSVELPAVGSENNFLYSREPRGQVAEPAHLGAVCMEYSRPFFPERLENEIERFKFIDYRNIALKMWHCDYPHFLFLKFPYQRAFSAAKYGHVMPGFLRFCRQVENVALRASEIALGNAVNDFHCVVWPL